MKLVVGLGNPGRKYEGTRHNAGYMTLDFLAKKHGAGRPKSAFQGETNEISLHGERILLLWPQTFMNRSGTSVVQARDFYKLSNAELLLISDDLNLPLGRLRVRMAGSAGGQNGLKDVIRCLGTEEFARLRVGVGPVPSGWNPADFVLGKFAAAEKIEIEIAVVKAAEAVECWAAQGTAACMNRFNAGEKPDKPDKPDKTEKTEKTEKTSNPRTARHKPASPPRDSPPYKSPRNDEE